MDQKCNFEFLVKNKIVWHELLNKHTLYVRGEEKTAINYVPSPT